MREEAGLIATVPAAPDLDPFQRAVSFAATTSLVFAVDAFTLEAASPADGEIAEIGWFAPDALPEDAHRSTRARLGEIFGGAPAAPDW
jgi:hypothetical protein